MRCWPNLAIPIKNSIFAARKAPECQTLSSSASGAGSPRWQLAAAVHNPYLVNHKNQLIQCSRNYCWWCFSSHPWASALKSSPTSITLQSCSQCPKLKPYRRNSKPSTSNIRPSSKVCRKSCRPRPRSIRRKTPTLPRSTSKSVTTRNSRKCTSVCSRHSRTMLKTSRRHSKPKCSL